jgi:hypothetical protein
MKAKLILTGIALTALTAFAFSQEPDSAKGQRNGTGKATAYVDSNKNGICDNYENKSADLGRHGKNVTAGKAGCGHHNGQGCGQCGNNGCGNQEGQGCGQHAGQRSGQNQGRGHGKSKNFVDANKNGICDYKEATSEK